MAIDWDYGTTAWHVPWADNDDPKGNLLESKVWAQVCREINARAGFINETPGADRPIVNWQDIGTSPADGALVGVDDTPFPHNRIKLYGESWPAHVYKLSNYTDPDAPYELWTNKYKGTQPYFPGNVPNYDFDTQADAPWRMVLAAQSVLSKLRYRRYGYLELLDEVRDMWWGWGNNLFQQTRTGIVTMDSWTPFTGIYPAYRIYPLLFWKAGAGFQDLGGGWDGIFRGIVSSRGKLIRARLVRDNWTFQFRIRSYADGPFMLGEFGSYELYAPFSFTQRIYALKEIDWYNYKTGIMTDPLWLKNNTTPLQEVTTVGSATNDCNVYYTQPDLANQPYGVCFEQEIHSWTDTSNWLKWSDPWNWRGCIFSVSDNYIKWSGSF